jgi:hypothetical protein
LKFFSEICTKYINTLRYQNVEFLGAFAKFRKTTISFVISVRLSVRLSTWNNSAATGRIFMEFDIWAFFEKSIQKMQVSLQADKINKYFTWRRLYTYDHISLNSC